METAESYKVSTIVSRFTSFTWNFVIPFLEITKIFRSGHDYQCVCCMEPLLSWSSCRCRSFGPLGSECRYGAYPIPLYSAALKLIHEKNSRVRSCVLELFRPQDSPTILLTILADHATGFTVRSRCLHFFCFFRFVLVHATGFSVLCCSYSLLVDAGCNVGITASCNTDVGDVGVVELEEPVDKPGTTIGTQFSVLHCIRLPSLTSCGS